MFNNNFLMVSGGPYDPRPRIGGAELLAEALESYANRFMTSLGSSANSDDYSLIDYEDVTVLSRGNKTVGWSQGPDGLIGTVTNTVNQTNHRFKIQRLKGQPDNSYDGYTIKGSSFYTDPTIDADLSFSRWAHYIPTNIWSEWKQTDFGDHYHAYAYLHGTNNTTTAVSATNTRNGVTAVSGTTADVGTNHAPWLMERLVYIDPTDLTVRLIRQVSHHSSTQWQESWFTDSDKSEDITARVLNWYYGVGNWKHDTTSPDPLPIQFPFDIRNCQLGTAYVTRTTVNTDYWGQTSTNVNWHIKAYQDGSGTMFWCRAGNQGLMLPKPFIKSENPSQSYRREAGMANNPMGSNTFSRDVHPSISGIWIEGYDSGVSSSSNSQIMFVPWSETATYQNDTTNGNTKAQYWGNLAHRAVGNTRQHIATLGNKPQGVSDSNTWFEMGIWVDPDETYLMKSWYDWTNRETVTIERWDIDMSHATPTLTYVSSGSFNPRTLTGQSIVLSDAILIDASGNLLVSAGQVTDTLLGGAGVQTGSTPTTSSTSFGNQDRLVYQFQMSDVTDPTQTISYVGAFYFTGENGANNRAEYTVTHSPPSLFFSPRSCAAKQPTFSSTLGGFQCGRDVSNNDITFWYPTTTNMDVQ